MKRCCVVLIGPFIDTWLRVYPDDFDGAADFWKGLKRILAMRAPVRSTKSSMPPNRSSREDVSRKPGV